MMSDEAFDALSRQAEAAAALLEHPAYQAAVAACEAQIAAEWAQVAWSAPSLREQKFAEVKGLQLVRDRLNKWISDAKFEAEAREKRRLRRVA